MDSITALVDLPIEECGTDYAPAGFRSEVGEPVWGCILVARRRGGFCIAVPIEFPSLDGSARVDVPVRLATDEGEMSEETQRISLLDLADDWGGCLLDLSVEEGISVDHPIDLAGWPHGESIRGAFEEWAASGAQGEEVLPEEVTAALPGGRGRPLGGPGGLEEVGGKGKGAIGRGRGKPPAPASPRMSRPRKPSITVADLHTLLSEELGGIRSRLTLLESGSASAPPGLAPPALSAQSPLLGGPPPRLSAAEAAEQARVLLGRGAGVPGGTPTAAGGNGVNPSGYSRADLLRAQQGYGPRAPAAALASFGGVAGSSAGGRGATRSNATAQPAGPSAAEGGSADPTATALLALAKAITGQKGGSLEDDFGLGTGAMGSEEEYAELWNGESARSATKPTGLLAIEKIRRTRELHPEVVIVSHEKTARQVMGVLPGEAWSWRRHCADQVLPHVRTFRTLRRMLVAVAAGLDEGRMGGPDRMAAYFHHLYRVLESAAKEPGHDMAWGFPILGIEDPDASRARAGWAPAEDAALAAYHKEEHLMEQVRRSLMKGSGKGSDSGGKGSEDVGKGSLVKISGKAAAAKASAAKPPAAPPSQG
jgi:hypothetical protein